MTNSKLSERGPLWSRETTNFRCLISSAPECDTGSNTCLDRGSPSLSSTGPTAQHFCAWHMQTSNGFYCNSWERMNETLHTRREIFGNISYPPTGTFASRHINSPKQFISISKGIAVRWNLSPTKRYKTSSYKQFRAHFEALNGA